MSQSPLAAAEMIKNVFIFHRVGDIFRFIETIMRGVSPV